MTTRWPARTPFGDQLTVTPTGLGPIQRLIPLARGLPDSVTRRAVDQLETVVGQHSKLIEAVTGVGVYLGRQVFTASGTYVPSTGATSCVVREVGGGGGAGQATGAGSGAAASGGGSSGVYLEFVLTGTTQLTGGAVTIGAGGASAANGGDTSVVIDGLTYTAKGGTAGGGMTATAGYNAATGGAMQTGTSSPVGAVTAWTPGATGLIINGGSLAPAGNGGSGPWGAGGIAAVSVGPGGAGGGYGAGGGGSVCTTSSRAGGAGSGGLLMIDEFG